MAVAALAIAGCGGADSLSAEEFAAEANSICAADGVVGGGVDGDEQSKLRELEPPQGLRRRVDDWLAARDRAAALARSGEPGAREAAERADALGAEFGVDACAVLVGRE